MLTTLPSEAKPALVAEELLRDGASVDQVGRRHYSSTWIF